MARPLPRDPGRAQRDVPVYPVPRAAGRPFDPPPELAALQAQGPLVRVRLWDGSTPWLVTRHAGQRALLADPRISANVAHPGYPHPSESFRERRARFRAFIGLDDPEHARLRRMVNAPFASRRAEALRPAIQAIVDELIGKLLAGPKPADLVAAFALPVPSLVICQLLGVPYADHDFFQFQSRTLINRVTAPAAAQEAQRALHGYLRGLITRKLADPADDLLSRLAIERVRTGELTRREVASIGILLLVAGHETTANMITLGTLALLDQPDQLAALRETRDPTLIAGAVEELLRYLSIVHSGRRRVALADIEIGGQVIRAGEGVIMPNDLANRDTSVFEDPGRLDIHRDARRHLSFGFGVHQCLGKPLAQVELQVAYSTLYRRIPTLSLATAVEDLRFEHEGLVYGIHELPVTW
jgi:cytochrome P450